MSTELQKSWRNAGVHLQRTNHFLLSFPIFMQGPTPWVLGSFVPWLRPFRYRRPAPGRAKGAEGAVLPSLLPPLELEHSTSDRQGEDHRPSEEKKRSDRSDRGGRVGTGSVPEHVQGMSKAGWRWMKARWHGGILELKNWSCRAPTCSETPNQAAEDRSSLGHRSIMIHRWAVVRKENKEARGTLGTLS